MTSAAAPPTIPAPEARPARFLSRIAFPLLLAGYFALITVALFGVDLLWRPRAVVSAAEMDIDRQFYAWREFAFAEWRATGRPPLWNPYAFGGVPALGNFQYALLYPPNWLHLVLPTAWAINLIAALHVWLAGVLTAAWCRARGGSSVACIIGGTIFALSGPFLLHLYAGHLTYLCVVAWTPLVVLCVDRIINSSSAPARQQPLPVPATVLGAAAIAMQILGGYPQPAFYTALCVIVYAGARLRALQGARPRIRAVALVVLMYSMGGALAGAQLLPGLDAARQSVRASAADFAFATTYSLPPENLLTLVVPYPFGDDFSAPYSGRWVLWEMSLYVGGVAVTLAACAMMSAGRRRHAAVAVVLMLAILLALGSHTPLFRVLYELVPGVDRFRAPARFAFIAALMISALAAAGFDALRDASFRRRTVATIAGMLALALFAISLTNTTTRQLGGVALIFAQLALILVLMTRWPRVAYLLPLLVLFELWRPATRTIEWFRPRSRPQVLASIQPDERVVTTSERLFNLTTQRRIEDAWGYDPATSARWADLVGPLLGADARRGDFAPTKDPSETKMSPIWPMLRVRQSLPPTTQRLSAQPMPRVAVISHAVVVDGPAASLAAVRAADFDPRTRVILESMPSIAPLLGDGDAGVATVVHRTADSLTIDATLTRPAILLITDAYSAGWRADPPHEIMPANHALRAIALGAGKHRIRLEYRPSSFRIGIIVSAAALLVALLSLTLQFRRRTLIRGGS